MRTYCRAATKPDNKSKKKLSWPRLRRVLPNLVHFWLFIHRVILVGREMTGEWLYINYKKRVVLFFWLLFHATIIRCPTSMLLSLSCTRERAQQASHLSASDRDRDREISSRLGKEKAKRKKIEEWRAGWGGGIGGRPVILIIPRCRKKERYAYKAKVQEAVHFFIALDTRIRRNCVHLVNPLRKKRDECELLETWQCQKMINRSLGD